MEQRLVHPVQRLVWEAAALANVVGWEHRMGHMPIAVQCPVGLGTATSTRRWLQIGASVQPKSNNPHLPKCGRAWMEPSAAEQPQATCGSLGSRAWLDLSASAQPQAQTQTHGEGPVPTPPVSSERHVHLELITLMVASSEVDHLTKVCSQWDGLNACEACDE